MACFSDSARRNAPPINGPRPLSCLPSAGAHAALASQGGTLRLRIPGGPGSPTIHEIPKDDLLSQKDDLLSQGVRQQSRALTLAWFKGAGPRRRDRCYEVCCLADTRIVVSVSPVISKVARGRLRCD